MSGRTVRRLTVAAALVLALAFAGPAAAAAGPFEVAAPAVQASHWLDLFLGWFGDLWNGVSNTSTDKSTVTVPTDPNQGAGDPTGSATAGPGSGSREQGGTIDPDG